MNVDLAQRQRLEALTQALYSGVLETPAWSTFLQLLRETVGGDYATLALPPRGGRLDQTSFVLVDGNGTAEVHELDETLYFALDNIARVNRPMPREGIPYSADELFADPTFERDRFYRDLLGRMEIKDLRQVRVREPSGIDAWLTVARSSGKYDGDVDALLAELAPILRGVLQIYIGVERERVSASLNAEALARLKFGWIVLDAAGRVLDANERARAILASSKVLCSRPDGRLRIQPDQLNRQILAALDRLIKDPAAKPGAFILSREPWLDMLLVRAKGSPLSYTAEHAAIAFVSGDDWRSEDRTQQLAELFGLSPREARLALALSRGMTISEAAAQFGLTVASARTYSKSLFAKMGARGQPDLVRMVINSILALATEI